MIPTPMIAVLSHSFIQSFIIAVTGLLNAWLIDEWEYWIFDAYFSTIFLWIRPYS